MVVTVNQTNMRRIDPNLLGSASGYQDDSDSPDDEEEAIAVGAEGTSGFGRHARAERTWVQKHDEKFSNFAMCLLSRMYNSHTKCFMYLALSCVLLATGVPRSTWSLLLSLTGDRLQTRGQWANALMLLGLPKSTYLSSSSCERERVPRL